jgi:hypothetical protein
MDIIDQLHAARHKALLQGLTPTRAYLGAKQSKKLDTIKDQRATIFDQRLRGDRDLCCGLWIYQVDAEDYIHVV